ncbi:hypothetical protein AAVH_26215 [Aphelenchoides avenae]|nr:hypothetical protein AAVH_26215 [Aphelenchus avenae]
MRLFAAFFALNSALLCVDAVDSSTAKAFIRYKTVPDIIVTPPQYPIYARFPGGSQVRLGSGLHRYALLAYEQPALINPQYSGIAGFNVQDFVKANNLAAAARWELFPRSGW